MQGWIVLHVLGAILFLGNVVTAAFWKISAERSGDIAHLHRTAKSVMRADYIFTLPGLLLLIVSGGALAGKAGYSLAELNWLSVSLVLFVVTGLIWVFVLLPCQRRMIAESARSLAQGELSPEYRRASRRWDSLGLIATLIPLVILAFMVLKPF